MYIKSESRRQPAEYAAQCHDRWVDFIFSRNDPQKVAEKFEGFELQSFCGFYILRGSHQGWIYRLLGSLANVIYSNPQK